MRFGIEREYRMMQDVAATAAGKMTGQAQNFA